MKRTLLYIMLLAFIPSTVLSQSRDISKVDSIVGLAISLSEEALFEAKFEEAKKAVDLLYFENFTNYKPKHKILLTIQDIRITGFMNIVFARKANNLENFQKLKSLLPFAKDLDDYNVLGQYFLALSIAYRSIGKSDSSSIYQERAISIFDKTRNFEEVAKIRAGNISRHHNELLQEGKKQEILELIPKYKEEIAYSKVHSMYALSYNTRHLAQIYLRQTFNYEEALRLFNLSLGLRNELGFKPFIPASYSSLGDVYIKMGAYDQAIKMYTRSLEIAKDIGFVRYQLYPNLQMGDIYIEKKQADQALEYYLEALKLATENNYIYGIDQSIDKIRKMDLTKK
ncbi:tetratricopeptide repeat protein [Lutimonas vermicola]|uniref:Tetratricopeptide repeat protein n=1 Tax=Lutimonas vermicola TaxID=414288 RepID=A0ABU9L5U1_9FLAO